MRENMFKGYELFYELDANSVLARFLDSEENPNTLIATTRILHVRRRGRVVEAEFIDTGQGITSTWRTYNPFGSRPFNNKIPKEDGDYIPFDANYILAPDGTLWRQKESLTSKECRSIFYISDKLKEQQIQGILDAKYERVQQTLPSDPRISKEYVAHPESMAQREDEYRRCLGYDKDLHGERLVREEIGELFSEGRDRTYIQLDRNTYNRGVYSPIPSSN